MTFFVVYKLDRFARNQEDHVMVRAILKRAGTELRSVTETIDETPVGRAMEGMISVFAELDNNMRTERTMQGMLERLKQGVWVWQAPLGYYRPNKGSNITPEPNRSDLIRLAFEEYSKGTYTYKRIASFLIDRGLKTRQGKNPSTQLMQKILTNPIYCGKIDIWGGHKGTFEPIISESLFAKCQPDYMKSAHASPRSANNPLFPLRKLVVCEECETSLTGSSSRNRHGTKYPYYHHPHPNCDKTKSIPKESFEQLFVEYLDDITPNSKYEKLFKAIVLDEWQNRYKKIDNANAQIRREISALEAERQKVFDFHRAGKYTDADFLEQKNLINEQIDKKHSLIQEKREEEFEMEGMLDYCFSYVRTTAKSWKKAEYMKKLRLQKLIFAGSIKYDGKKFGTPDLRLLYGMNQLCGADKSNLVAPRGIGPLLPG
ncbi:MAG: Site-specific recombinase [Candidatus Moranbacteria bacterium GW2011_GWE1_36_7]|nr:MAG: Site-specific recombinase [Candidatus Moranbacteria bacterium GW2011_GWD2_36_12]KKQ05513.1 MAG: Site-specific recombinase [Candidatus Moranbacteria bacterium GW2011_GWE2_36_40]KKQ14527.1 MAG: Site-specific recombinase [Candidatus Moranbacteria bacterium GW2011_GWE1_36_7]